MVADVLTKIGELQGYSRNELLVQWRERFINNLETTVEIIAKDIASINSTPASTTIKKDKHDITIKCNKKGYQEAIFFNKSDAAGATVGNIILGGGIGWAVDSASGADNKYTSPVNMTLVPAEKGAKKKK